MRQASLRRVCCMPVPAFTQGLAGLSPSAFSEGVRQFREQSGKPAAPGNTQPYSDQHDCPSQGTPLTRSLPGIGFTRLSISDRTRYNNQNGRMQWSRCLLGTLGNPEILFC